jgi:DtxR family Mn-dependent transcriptional regulator
VTAARSNERPVTATDEDYLKAIYAIELDHDRAATSMLAERLGFSPATVTGQLKKLHEQGWIVYSPYRGASLTDTGRAIALEVLRHHRLIEAFLSHALKIPWDRVHDEAERLEHALSEYLEDRIDEYLGHPSVDPHGAPIPTRAGLVADSGRLRLGDLAVGEKAEIVEVSDRDSGLLAHLESIGLRPGTELSVLSVEPFDGLITIRTAEGSRTIGSTSAGQIIVRKDR